MTREEHDRFEQAMRQVAADARTLTHFVVAVDRHTKHVVDAWHAMPADSAHQFAAQKRAEQGSGALIQTRLVRSPGREPITEMVRRWAA